MSNLIAISRKIKDMQSILKISEALQLISSTKLKSYKQIMVQGSDYQSGVNFLFEKFYTSYEHDYRITNSKFVFSPKKQKYPFWIVIGSDLSLCGRFNRQIVDFMVSKFPSNGFILVFGKKLFNLLSSTRLKNFIIANYPSEMNQADISKKISEITKWVLKEYVTRNCYTLQLIFKGSDRPFNNLRLLPFTSDYFGKKNIKYETHEYRVRSTESVIELFPIYLEATLLNSLLDSKIAEHNLRREIMNNAVKAAEEKLNEYKILYQKIRQATITQEISQITAALKCKTN
ncbi:ATP synthase F1 sector subunit gamma [Candidatus Mycoplasma haematolamae str. Purdue]|uniref:ATP synthase F1 sector subunit gamma n=1 Tax=Mycoplasma haematolamae (strain Purdue) TaxID=1212765 RepID=I7BJ53_MYCHA|nr:FoF1 ATP synthase subunit gamma [Candidatus Mycoplasma haematolamae]AFO51868.1 ATP synthase F1 sector subunit gamma [Candidatus Mycoplasma haematolamae str. Purdue]